MAISSMVSLSAQPLLRLSALPQPSPSRRVQRAGPVRCEGSKGGDSVSIRKVERRPVLQAALGAITLAAAPVAGLAWPEAAHAKAVAKEQQFDDVVAEAVAMHVSAPVWMVLQAVLHDAASYDKESKTGGANGSLQFELDRPENEGLKEVASQIDAAKAMIDANEFTLAPISWSDMLALAGLRKLTVEFKEHLCGMVKNGLCDQAYNAYGNKPPNTRVGRVDAVTADGTGLIPAPGSSAAEYKALFQRMGLSVSELCVLSPALTGDYDTSIALLRQDAQCAKILTRLSKVDPITRTSYEVPFFKAYAKLANTGARFRKDAGYF